MDKFCSNPFTRIQINATGDVYTCCPAWLPKPIGNIFHETLPEIWNSKTANLIRKTILDGTFTYCAPEICPKIVSRKIYRIHELIKRRGYSIQHKICQYLPLFRRGPRLISLCYDYSCNLYCKSCRTEKWVLNKEKQQEVLAFQRVFLGSKYFQDVERLIVTGNGDPFASQVYMELFRSIRRMEAPKLHITLRTNGILLTPKNWDRLQNVHYAVDQIWISIDATTEHTYQRLRKGGDFRALLKNLAFLQDLKQHSRIKIKLYFVVQKLNYQEMEQFVELAKQFHCDNVSFSRIQNWNTYSPEEFHEVAVHEPDHPEFMNLKTIITKPVFREPMVYLSNLSHLLD
ncbi:MAG: radical SAM protein [bacterium]|nr:radical SAM protein [bacterium]